MSEFLDLFRERWPADGAEHVNGLDDCFDARAFKLASSYASLSQHVGDQGKDRIGSEDDVFLGLRIPDTEGFFRSLVLKPGQFRNANRQMMRRFCQRKCLANALKSEPLRHNERHGLALSTVFRYKLVFVAERQEKRLRTKREVHFGSNRCDSV